MIYHIFYPLAERFFIFNVTKYITFRGGCAFVTSFLIVMLLWKFTLKRLKRLRIIEKIDMYGHIHLESLHGGKRGTPTMGGILIVFSMVVSTCIWARWDNYFIWSIMMITVFLAILGFSDDFLKIKRGKGLARREKLFWQSIIGIVLGVLILS